MKLTLEQTDYIEENLESIGVKYLDIRYEMLDHIASVMEETPGDFYENADNYFFINRFNLIKQYKKLKRQAVIKAFKLYLRILKQPLNAGIFASVFIVINYTIKNFIADYDINLFTLMVLIALLTPFIWFIRGNKRISVMRSLTQGLGWLNCIYLWFNVFIVNIENDRVSALIMRYNSSAFIALMIVLLISIYSCRKQYAGKYI